MDYKTWLKAFAFSLTGVVLGYNIAESYKMKTHRNVIIEPYFERKDFAKKMLEMLSEYDVKHIDSDALYVPSRTNGKVIFIDRNLPLRERREKVIKSIIASDEKTLDITEEELDKRVKLLYQEMYEWNFR